MTDYDPDRQAPLPPIPPYCEECGTDTLRTGGQRVHARWHCWECARQAGQPVPQILIDLDLCDRLLKGHRREDR